jgi:tetratricopeptide (TPR) repeat protein
LLYLRTERHDLALDHLEHAAELGLNTANLFGALGYLNQQAGSYWGAASAYEKALMLDHDNKAWQQGLLYAFSETRQHESALSLVDQMLTATPDDPGLWLFRSNFALLADDRASALASLETAIRLGNNDVANLQVAATLHLEQGSVSRGISLLQDGMDQGIDYAFIDQALQWLVRAENWEGLADLLEAAQAVQDGFDSEQRSSLLTRQAHLDLHNDAETRAITSLQQALDLDPSNAEALLLLANIYRENRNFNQAELLYQRASAFDAYRENALISLAQLAIDQNNYQRALQVLSDVVRRNPSRSDLRRNIESLENLVLLQTEN